MVSSLDVCLCAGHEDTRQCDHRRRAPPRPTPSDEDGVWCAHAQLRPSVGANGEGATREATVADLREALVGLIAEFGAPEELTLTVDVA
jgi:hypothetical protein